MIGRDARLRPIRRGTPHAGAGGNHFTQELVMNRLMFAAVFLGSSLAIADPPSPNDLPAECRSLAEVPASAHTPGPGLAAELSVANCVAEPAMNGASVRELDDAIAASMNMLDDVIRADDPYWTVRAESAKRDLDLAMIVRTRIALESDPSAAESLQSTLARWRDAAARETDSIAMITRSDPGLATRDAVIAEIVQALPEVQPVTSAANTH
jgi:hypothetical protein